jgi:hypothetical protein
MSYFPIPGSITAGASTLNLNQYSQQQYIGSNPFGPSPFTSGGLANIGIGTTYPVPVPLRIDPPKVEDVTDKYPEFTWLRGRVKEILWTK